MGENQPCRRRKEEPRQNNSKKNNYMEIIPLQIRACFKFRLPVQFIRISQQYLYHVTSYHQANYMQKTNNILFANTVNSLRLHANTTHRC